jgi:uncharacterized repeat protein (TIGR03847 family)
MAERDLGALVHIAAEAQGQPGQRRFRIQVLNGANESGSFWLEKEQLAALGEAIEQVLRDEDYRHREKAPDDRAPVPVFPLNADYDFRVGQLSVGLDRERESMVLLIGEAVDEEEADVVRVSFSFERAYVLRREITSTVSAGRPPCPLCTAPLDPSGHVCVRTNGHHPH